jgi:16S rRNA (uracil1498-N3)-methyltransferase
MPDARSRRERPARVPRLHQSEGLAPGAIVRLDEGALRHVAALRLQRGDAVVLFGGDGDEYEAELVELTKRGAAAKVVERRTIDRESPLAITLAQGVCAADRMDLVIQKATELGVQIIQPVITTRTVIRLSGERQDRREQHWQAVAIAACEQCGRNRLPAILPSIKLDEFVATLPAAELRVMLAPAGTARIASLAPARSVLLAVGPEGGLTDDERALLASRDFVGVRLGPRILRTETAPLAAIAALQALWGDG